MSELVLQAKIETTESAAVAEVSKNAPSSDIPYWVRPGQKVKFRHEDFSYELVGRIEDLRTHQLKTGETIFLQAAIAYWKVRKEDGVVVAADLLVYQIHRLDWLVSPLSGQLSEPRIPPSFSAHKAEAEQTSIQKASTSSQTKPASEQEPTGSFGQSARFLLDGEELVGIVERDRFRRLIKIWVDGGYRGKNFQHWVIDVYRWILSVVTRHEEQKGFVVLPKRWLVERTFGWFNWCRRLSKDYEILPETTEAFIYVAMIRLMLKQLA